MVKTLSVLICIFISSSAYANNFYLLEPTDIHTDLYKYEDDHDAYLYPIDKTISEGVSFNINMNVIRWNDYALHWNNDLFFDQNSTTQQIVHAGYHYELGLNILNDWHTGKPRVELFKEHQSEHILDTDRPVHFPVYDRYGVRLRIYP